MTSAPHPDSSVDGTDEGQNPELLFCVKTELLSSVKGCGYHATITLD